MQIKSKYFTSVQVEDMLCTESHQIMGGGGKEGVKESDREVLTDQSKAYSQLGCIENPFKH
jgi:hypothetical protein